MIRVLVEMWNGGDPKDRYYIGEVRIGRDDDIPASAPIGAYTVALHQASPGIPELVAKGTVELVAKGRVENFPRKEKDAMDLTKLALDVLLKERSKRRQHGTKAR
jgi:hypothetical protein